jgi:hypothetical protein
MSLFDFFSALRAEAASFRFGRHADGPTSLAGGSGGAEATELIDDAALELGDKRVSI